MPPNERTREGYVAISRADLPQLRLEHLTSEVDPTIAVPDRLAQFSAELVSGFSEWIGDWRGDQVTIGWDWGAYRGEIVVLYPAEVRTNIRLIGADGAPDTAVLTRLRLAEWLETIAWREPIHGLLGGAAA